MAALWTKLEVLDLRHFSAPALRPLLEEETERWNSLLHWDYSQSMELLLQYVDSRSLTGYVALRHGRVAGYAFGVCEATKAVLGDVFAFGEGGQHANPVCEQLLTHLIETLQATPGIERIESQLLLFPEGALEQPFRAQAFHAHPRCFMLRQSSSVLDAEPSELLGEVRLESWRPEAYAAAAALIQAAYLGHTDAEINDQYRTLAGAQRFLHNIVHFPGCGVFDPQHSWLLYDRTAGQLVGMALCSRVRDDVAHITQLCVARSHRGKGLGAALLRHCLTELARTSVQQVSLTVTARNHDALRLYAREGFVATERFDAWVWQQQR